MSGWFFHLVFDVAQSLFGFGDKSRRQTRRHFHATDADNESTIEIGAKASFEFGAEASFEFGAEVSFEIGAQSVFHVTLNAVQLVIVYRRSTMRKLTEFVVFVDIVVVYVVYDIVAKVEIDFVVIAAGRVNQV